MVHDDVQGPHAGDEGPFRVAGERAVAPQAETIVADDGRDVGVVQQVGAAAVVAIEELDFKESYR